MALYEYQCAMCGRKTEVIQRYSDPAPTKCPHCGGVLTKLLSSPAFQFKGSGFHSTDYGKSGGKLELSSKEKEGDSKGKEDSSKVKEGVDGGTSEPGAGFEGDSAGDSSKEKKDSKDPSKEKSPDAAKDAGPSESATASSSPSKKNTKRK